MRNQIPLIHESTYSALEAGTGVPITVVVWVSGIDPPTVRADGQIQFRVRLRDHGNTCEVRTLPVTDLDLVRKAQHACTAGIRVIAGGRFVAAPAPRKDADAPLALDLTDLRPVDCSTALLGASQQQIDDADALIARLSATPGAIHQHLIDGLCSALDVSPDSFDPRFRKCLKLTMLQALSAGQVAPGTNPRLSTFFYSDPGAGKKVLARAAAAMAPISAFGQPALLTLAGLACRVEQRNGRWEAFPGAMPLSSGGVCIIEDAHRFPTNQINAIQATLMSAAEDGKVASTKAAAATYSAECALHINGNRFSTINGNVCGPGLYARTADLGMKIDLLSRFDVLVEVDCNEDAADSARIIATTDHELTTHAQALLDAERVGPLKLLVSRLIDRFPQVDTSQVSGRIGTLMDQITAVLRDDAIRLNSALEPDSLLRRMANTVRKLVGSAARLNGRGVATVEDVECAEEMIRFKLEVLRWLCGDGDRVRPLGRLQGHAKVAQRNQELRFRDLLVRCGGRDEVTLSELAQSIGYSERLVRRELRQRGYVAKAGVYDLPTLWQYEMLQRDPEKLPRAPLPGELTEEDTGPAGEEHIEWRDCLKEVPVRHQPIVEGLNEVYLDKTVRVAKNLCKLALSETTEEIEVRIGIGGTFRMMSGKAQLYVGPRWEEFMEEVIGMEPVRRGVYLLEVYAASRLPTVSYVIEEELKGREVAPALRVAAEAVLARLGKQDRHEVALTTEEIVMYESQRKQEALILNGGRIGVRE